MPKLLLSLILIALLAAALPPAPARAQPGGLGVQAFLDGQPGPLKRYREEGRAAAAIIEGGSLYYGISPRLHLALLEATAGLLSDPAPPDQTLRQPFGAAGPIGFAAQIEWASRELRAGLGPYSRPPTVRFTDGLTFTLTLDQAPEGVAVQRFLAKGRTRAQWLAAVDAFTAAFQRYFNNELVTIGDWGLEGQPPTASPQPPAAGFLLQPWPAGTRVVHLAYFDHVYPTVDSGDDGNGFVVNYLNQGNLQYDGHDGHDYYFPDDPIGTPILAAAAGTAYARTHRGKGVVIIHPGGYETVYWHLDSFAAIFSGRIDSGEGVPVAAGDLIGTSGATGFVRGTPHLHFEVRRFGKQIDPYGWYGPGVDPCALYAGCLPGEWLWHPALIGTYDFTPPGVSAARSAPAPRADTTPPQATLTVNPPAPLLFRAEFDGSAVQSVGHGFPTIDGGLRFEAGYAGEGLRLGAAGLTYPTAGNLSPTAGTISLWANLPADYPPSRIGRHYLLAASASPDGAPVYSGTLALRRDTAGPDGTPHWVFWTTAAAEESRDLLAAPDTLAPGWHHFTITWDSKQNRKSLYINGALAAQSTGVSLPERLGPAIQIGRFTYGGGPAGATLDRLKIFGAALSPEAVAELAAAPPEAASAPLTVGQRGIRLDTNAIDDEGGIVAVQLGIDGEFADPQPYYDSYRWQLPEAEGAYVVAARYIDRAGNSAVVSQTVILALPPAAEAALEERRPAGATIALRTDDGDPALEMQISRHPDFRDALWQPYRARSFWAWEPGRPRTVYIRLRDSTGAVGPSVSLSLPPPALYLPLLAR